MPLGGKQGGRVAGTPNKVSALAKDNIISVFTRLGGTAAMAIWAQDNQTEFYRIYSRLLPTELTGKNGGPIEAAIELSTRPQLTKEEWLSIHGLGASKRPTK